MNVVDRLFTSASRSRRMGHRRGTPIWRDSSSSETTASSCSKPRSSSILTTRRPLRFTRTAISSSLVGLRVFRDLAPRPRMINSNVLFLVGGTGAPTFERENVRSVGFTEDLPRFFAVGDIATLPKDAGSGTRLKLFQYTNRGFPS